MDTLKELFGPKTFNKISHFTVLIWILIAVIFLGIFAAVDNTEFRSNFHCDGAKGDITEFNRGKCFDQYEGKYNKYSVPIYGFVIINFLFIGIVCLIYSQVVRPTVDQLSLDQTGNKLFIAYCFQLSLRLVLRIIFIILQTQLLYPLNFSTNFYCDLTDGTTQLRNSCNSTQNSTCYECNNQQAIKKTFWLNAVLAVNGIFVLVILIETVYILLRAWKERSFMQNSEFLRAHLNPPSSNSHQKPQKQDDIIPRQPREREHLPAQGELNETPENKGGGDEHETVPLQPGEHENLPTQSELNETPEQKEGGDVHETVPLPAEHKNLPTQGELNETPEQKNGSEEHETVPLQPGEHENLPTQGELNETTEKKEGGDEHETVPLQPGERENLPTQSELHETPEQKEESDEHETVPRQPGERENLPTQSELHETPKQKEGGDEHETVPLQTGEHENLPTQGEQNETPEQKEGSDVHETVLLQPKEHERQPSQGELNEISEEKEGGDEDETFPLKPGKHGDLPTQGELNETPEQKEGSDEQGTVPLQPGERQPSQGELKE